MSKFVMVLCLSVLTLGICGCGSAQPQTAAPKSAAGTFQRVSSDEAAKMMAAEQGYLIVDVRTAKEYADGHIPNAIKIFEDMRDTELMNQAAKSGGIGLADMMMKQLSPTIRKR